MTFASRAAISLFFALSAADAGAQCSCQCVDGVARTLCTELDEAAERPRLCGAQPPLCPPATSTGARTRFEPPAAGASNCREAELGDPVRPEHTAVVKVCDTEQDTPEP